MASDNSYSRDQFADRLSSENSSLTGVDGVGLGLGRIVVTFKRAEASVVRR